MGKWMLKSSPNHCEYMWRRWNCKHILEGRRSFLFRKVDKLCRCYIIHLLLIRIGIACTAAACWDGWASDTVESVQRIVSTGSCSTGDATNRRTSSIPAGRISYIALASSGNWLICVGDLVGRTGHALQISRIEVAFRPTCRIIVEGCIDLQQKDGCQEDSDFEHLNYKVIIKEC